MKRSNFSLKLLSFMSLLALLLQFSVYGCGTKSATRISISVDDSNVDFETVEDVLVLLVAYDEIDAKVKQIVYPGSFNTDGGGGFQPQDPLKLKICFEACGDGVGYIEKGYEIEIFYCGRDASGAAIYWGQGDSRFVNDPLISDQTVSIKVNSASFSSCLDGLP